MESSGLLSIEATISNFLRYFFQNLSWECIHHKSNGLKRNTFHKSVHYFNLNLLTFWIVFGKIVVKFPLKLTPYRFPFFRNENINYYEYRRSSIPHQPAKDARASVDISLVSANPAETKRGRSNILYPFSSAI